MKRIKVSRTLCRAVYEEFSDRPLPSRSDKGRFHDSATKDVTTYLAERAHTAWREVTYRWQANEEAYRMVEVRVLLHQVVDLTDPTTQQHYGVDRIALTADDYAACQRLAHRLRAEGVEALWTYSSADQPEGCQLVVFLDQLTQDSEIQVVRTQTIAQWKEHADTDQREVSSRKDASLPGGARPDPRHLVGERVSMGAARRATQPASKGAARQARPTA